MSTADSLAPRLGRYPLRPHWRLHLITAVLAMALTLSAVRWDANYRRRHALREAKSWALQLASLADSLILYARSQSAPYPSSFALQFLGVGLEQRPARVHAINLRRLEGRNGEWVRYLRQTGQQWIERMDPSRLDLIRMVSDQPNEALRFELRLAYTGFLGMPDALRSDVAIVAVFSLLYWLSWFGLVFTLNRQAQLVPKSQDLTPLRGATLQVSLHLRNLLHEIKTLSHLQAERHGLMPRIAATLGELDRHALHPAGLRALRAAFNDLATLDRRAGDQRHGLDEHILLTTQSLQSSVAQLRQIIDTPRAPTATKARPTALRRLSRRLTHRATSLRRESSPSGVSSMGSRQR